MCNNRYTLDGKIHDAQRLRELQKLPLDNKILITQARLIEWYKYCLLYTSPSPRD